MLSMIDTVTRNLKELSTEKRLDPFSRSLMTQRARKEAVSERISYLNTGLVELRKLGHKKNEKIKITSSNRDNQRVVKRQ
ncbi:hypothetical protein AYI69_g10830 [Smittium culicis]|uniref:Uncharacterized protein n=1 Tax=Smittium culicis TaxID=133412 RepID=A0A1R1X382_9FUNG|nr:hypothetical protein AYI69_g10830 [Smittium culicis]